MRKILTLILFAISTLSLADSDDLSTKASQASKFQGPFLQMGIGYESIRPTHDSSTLSINGRSTPVTTSSNNVNNMSGMISAGWYQDIAEGYLLGVGLDYSPFASSTGKMSVTTVNSLPGQNNLTNDYKYQQKYSYNIFLSPAMTIGESGLAYTKVGFTYARVENYNTLKYDFTGYSLGLGYKQIFYDSLFGFAEANYADYGNETESATNPIAVGRTLNSSGTNGLKKANIMIGVGYKF
jgi:hypothetical protein